MEMCKACHAQVRSTDYYCFNCGKNLHEKPPSLLVTDQAVLYIASALLPPMGIIWGFKYLKQSDQKSKIVGLVAMAITVVVLVWVASYTMNIINSVSNEVDLQLNGLGGF